MYVLYVDLGEVIGSRIYLLGDILVRVIWFLSNSVIN